MFSGLVLEAGSVWQAAHHGYQNQTFLRAIPAANGARAEVPQSCLMTGADQTPKFKQIQPPAGVEYAHTAIKTIATEVSLQVAGLICPWIVPAPGHNQH